MRSKFMVNIDRLELCYTAPASTVEELINTKYQEFDGFRVYSTNKEDDTLKTYLLIEVRDKEEDGSLSWVRFGEISIGSSFEDAEAPTRYVWVSLCNEILYSPIYPHESCFVYVYDIAEALGLSFHNITRMEIALDSTVNFFYRIKRAVRSEELTPIVLGRAYDDRKEIIRQLLYIHTGDRTRYRTGSIVVKDKEKSCCLSAYDKSQEIEDSGKDYIAAWNSFTPIHRLEVRLTNKAIKDFTDKTQKTQNSIYMELQDKELLFDMFVFFSDRLLRFRNGRDSLSIVQL